VWCEAGLARVLAERRARPRSWSGPELRLLGGGKRLRPALVRLWCAELGGTDERACGPPWRSSASTATAWCTMTACMDDDDLRRGRPTVHKIYGDACHLVGTRCRRWPSSWWRARRSPPRPSCADAGPRRRQRGHGGRGKVLDLSLSAAPRNFAGVGAAHPPLKTAALIAAACELGPSRPGRRRPNASASRPTGTPWGCVSSRGRLFGRDWRRRRPGQDPGKDARLSAAPWWRSWVWRERGQRPRNARARRARRRSSWGSRAAPEPVLLVEHLLARGA